MPTRPTLRTLEQAPYAPPPGPAPVVPRPALVERLRALSRRTLTLVVAPTGYGKTTLLAQWAAAEERHVAWVALAPADAEPHRLWRRVAHAVTAALPALAAADAPAGTTADRALAALVNALTDGPELVVVLDDYHALGGACDETVGYFLERAPENVSVVLAARSRPPLELGSLPSRGEVGLLAAGDLLLDRETTAAAAALTGIALSGAELDELEQRTEGWPAGVRLALASLRAAGDLDAFSGAGADVADYFREEVLAAASRELRRFLLQTSVLERLTAPLCDRLLDRRDAAGRLAEAQRAGALLVPLDGDGDAFRYQRLFGEFLRSELDPAARARLHRRAASLLEEAGTIDEAVGHAAAGSGPAAARELLLRHWRALAAHEQVDEARRGLAAIGEAGAPPLAAAWVAAAEGGRAEPAGSGRGRLPFGTGDAELETALVSVWFAADADDVAAAERARALVEALPTVDPLLVAASSAALGAALYAAGRDEDALAAVAGIDPGTAATAPAPAVRGLAVRSLACARLGRPAAAGTAARGAEALIARHGLEGTPAAVVLHGARPAERTAPTAPRGPRRLRGELSDAELAVLRLLPTPLTQREIGRELYLSLNTVKTHAAAIYRALGVSSREQAVAAARRLNLLPG